MLLRRARVLMYLKYIHPHQTNSDCGFLEQALCCFWFNHREEECVQGAILHNTYIHFGARVMDKHSQCKTYVQSTMVIPLLSSPQVETIGDTYMLVAGLPKRLHLTHAAVVAESALALMKASHEFRIPHMPGSTLKLRVGMHSGMCIRVHGRAATCPLAKSWEACIL